MLDAYSRLAERALRDEPPTEAEAAWILDGEDVALLPLLHAAFVPREKHFGRAVKVHVLNNIQNGLCPEDCGYCSQSRDSDASIRKYPLKSDEEILAEAEAAARSGASRYCMVASGRGPTLERTRKLAGLVKEIKSRWPIEVCISAGLVDEEHARILADAGLDRFNHNLNTSEEHYAEICSTHTYEDRVRTLQAIKKCGIEPCSGLIMGMGETTDDLIGVGFRLRELEVQSIPVNFLIPIDGNPVRRDGSLSPERCLRALALMRLVNPRAELRAAGGREGHLRSLGALLLWPANSLFVEGYLTTRGDAVNDTYAMIRDAGFEVEGNADWEGELPERGEFRLTGGAGEILKPEIASETGRTVGR
ncbi:MAG: biotin synthase BioB [Deltaproteobacteria bacterium]|nr:biotin synthase BioB [Deltaproteobacteria bacterium]MBW2447982.1 biotin synthase BioB [Deltaproteobacteria bacterium]